MFKEFRAPLPVSTPRGNGFAYWALEYGAEHHVIWGVVLDASGEIWWVANPDVRVRPNETMRAPRKSGDENA